MNRKQLKQTAQAYKDLEEWTTVRDFCQQVYGENVATFEIRTCGEFNDEGGLNYHIDDCTAYNSQGNEIAFDLSLPFWQQSCFDDLRKEDASTLRLALMEWFPLEEGDTWVVWEELPIKEDGQVFDLTKKPIVLQ